MINKKTKALTKDAMLVALFAVFGVINIFTGTMFDTIFSYLIAVIMAIYTKKRTLKEASCVLIATMIILFLVGEIFFMLFSSLTMPMGIVYGEMLKRKADKKNINLILIIISITKNFIILVGFGKLMGIDTFKESLEMYNMIVNFLPGLRNILNPLIVSIVIGVFLAVAEAAIIISYTKIISKRFEKTIDELT